MMKTKKTTVLIFYFAIKIIIGRRGKVNSILLVFLLNSLRKTLPFLFSYFLFILDIVPDKYKTIHDKRLANVFRSVTALSGMRCVSLCSMTDGCLAVNVISNHDITCELTTGLSNETEMENAHNSQVLVLGKVFT